MQRKVLIFSAPSGSGKTTIVRHLIDVFPNLQFSVSATTRELRGTEIDGKDYYFLSEEEFKSKEFVESEEVYEGVFYGTLKSEVDRIWRDGKIVIFDVDVKGGISLKKYFGDDALAVFVKVPGISILKERLTDRNTENEESLKARFSRINYEMSFEEQFERVLLNNNLDEAFGEAQKLVSDFLQTDVP